MGLRTRLPRNLSWDLDGRDLVSGERSGVDAIVDGLSERSQGLGGVGLLLNQQRIGVGFLELREVGQIVGDPLASPASASILAEGFQAVDIGCEGLILAECRQHRLRLFVTKVNARFRRELPHLS